MTPTLFRRAAASPAPASPAELLANASIEMTVREAPALADAQALLAGGTGVYVPSLPARPLSLSLPLLADIHARGLDPVPHVAARRATSAADMASFLEQAVRSHGVHRVMLIGGDEDRPHGPWRDSVELLASGLLRDNGVREIGIAVYPEGHPKIAQPALRAALDHRLPDLPVYVGMPGPSDPMQLLRYAQRCGVGAARRALSSLGTRIAQLMAHTDPSEQLAVVARYAAHHGNVVGVHLFSFGGVVRTARWIQERMGTGGDGSA
jgi:methylenetetrahydrofolate reductase (NADPH)